MENAVTAERAALVTAMAIRGLTGIGRRLDRERRETTQKARKSVFCDQSALTTAWQRS
jgi:hypothetical protein